MICQPHFQIYGMSLKSSWRHIFWKNTHGSKKFFLHGHFKVSSVIQRSELSMSNSYLNSSTHCCNSRNSQVSTFNVSLMNRKIMNTTAYFAIPNLKEWNYVICNDVDECRGHAKRNNSGTEIQYDLTYL